MGGRDDGPGLAAGDVPCAFASWAGRSGGGGSRWAAGCRVQARPPGFPGPMFGQVQHHFPCSGRDACRNLDELASDCRRSRFAEVGARQRADGARQVEGDRRQYQPGCVRAEYPGWEVTQRAVFEIGVDLLDHRMLAVGFVRGDGVQIAGGEEGVEAVRVEQCRLPVAGERGEGDLSDFRDRDPLPCAFVEDRVGVLDRGPRGIGDGGEGAFDRRIHPHGDGHLRPGAMCGDHNRVGEVGAVGAQEHESGRGRRPQPAHCREDVGDELLGPARARSSSARGVAGTPR